MSLNFDGKHLRGDRVRNVLLNPDLNPASLSALALLWLPIDQLRCEFVQFIVFLAGLAAAFVNGKDPVDNFDPIAVVGALVCLQGL